MNAHISRPMNTVKSAPQLSRLTKKQGEFHLDLDDDEEQAPEVPNLIQHDLEEILNETVELPKTRFDQFSDMFFKLAFSTLDVFTNVQTFSAAGCDRPHRLWSFWAAPMMPSPP